jgi:GT2 family glycosyltransferase
VIVVDNGSTDDSVATIAGRWPAVKTIALGENRGFAAANNVGISATESDLVLLLNSDTVVRPSAIDVLVSSLRKDPAVVAAGPRLIDSTGRVELSFGRMMSPLAELRQKALVRFHERGMGMVSRYVETLTRQQRFVDWVSGACLLVRRSSAVEAGLLDERFFMYGEDVDFCAALRARGGKILFVPSAEVVHLRGRTGQRDPARRQREYRRSHVAFYAKHHPRWVPFLRAYLWLRGQ